jgi:hypothetical protein
MVLRGKTYRIHSRYLIGRTDRRSNRCDRHPIIRSSLLKDDRRLGPTALSRVKSMVKSIVYDGSVEYNAVKMPQPLSGGAEKGRLDLHASYG